MYWHLKKIVDEDSRIVYAYSRESKTIDGQVEYNKTTEEFKCLKLASGDTEEGVSRLYPHLWRTIEKENAPDKHFIATG